MTDTLAPLIRDFLEFAAARPRPYAEAVEAWRTSCPRLTIWEEAADRGLVERRPGADGALIVALTPRGRDILAAAP